MFHAHALSLCLVNYLISTVVVRTRAAPSLAFSPYRAGNGPLLSPEGPSGDGGARCCLRLVIGLLCGGPNTRQAVPVSVVGRPSPAGHR